jgi:L-asparaginase
VWEKLHTRISTAQNDPAIDAVIITHGTDTLEETAYFLHRTIACTKPVILTGAMRPADAPDSDGPQNVVFTLEQAEELSAGIWVVFAGKIFSGDNVRKAHPTRLDAFEVIDEDFVPYTSLIAFSLPIKRWPRVEVVMSYAGADGEIVDALIRQKVDGILVAATGNCTVHDALQAKLDKASQAGIAVSLYSRCLAGIPQARVELILKALMLSNAVP